MKHLAIAVASLFAASAQAAPFLTTDPVDPLATVCVLTMKGAAPQEFSVSTVSGQRICRIDVGPIFAAGPNDLTLAVARTDPVWGRVASPEVPFSSVKPGPLPAPTGIKLAP